MKNVELENRQHVIVKRLEWLMTLAGKKGHIIFAPSHWNWPD